MTTKIIKWIKHINIFCIVLLALLFTSCADKGFLSSDTKIDWFNTIVFLIITFAPALIALFLIKSDSESWDKLGEASLGYGILAIIILGISVWIGSWSNGTTWMLLTAIVAIAVVFFAIKISKKKFAVETQCPKCGELSALQEIDKVCTGSRSTTVTRTVETKNKKGDVIATTEVPVPATKYFYDK